MIRIQPDNLKNEFYRVLTATGFSAEKAEKLAAIFTANTVDGVLSHGINRFPRFISNTIDGLVQPDAEPEQVKSFGALEQWTGNLGPGALNAAICTERAIELAKENGIGCVALRETNHWLRGGTYGWQAANAGLALICWTNTTPNLPPYGAMDARIGNNPLIIAVPRKKGHVVLDIAMSQYSYGKLEVASITGEHLKVVGGYDTRGKLTTNPREILKTGRPLPIGFWKGSGLSIVLDMLTAMLSNGDTTVDIGSRGNEYALSQTFIAMDVNKTAAHRMQAIADQVIEYIHDALPVGTDEVYYPGERALKKRKQHLAHGIEIDEQLWEKILAL